MKKMFFAIFFVFSAHATSPKIYTFGKLTMAFIEVDGLVVNGACTDKNCEAYRKGLELKSIPLSNDMVIGGKNPGSVRCKAYMGGKLVTGRNSAGNEQSFCVFSDNSYLRNN